VVDDIRGDVYVRSSSGIWRTVAAGDTIYADERIVTGSNARVLLSIGPDTVRLSGYTNVKLESIRGSESEETRVEIAAGSLRAKVRTAGPERNRDRFTVQSPLATASVRGTDFDFNGVELMVYEGDVSLLNGLGQHHSVRAGQESRAFGLTRITSVEEVLKESVPLRR
jgi:hypothetical protein